MFCPAVRPPVFQQPLQDVTAPEGKSVHLEVRFTGSPAPDVAWFRGPNRILPSNMYKVSMGVGMILVIIIDNDDDNENDHDVKMDLDDDIRMMMLR
jgi:hypothetical protein